MAAPRQRRKSKSSISRVKQRTKSKRLIIDNPIIKANWRKGETFSQNFKRLGLSTSLNGKSGGGEKNVAAIRAAKEEGVHVKPSRNTLSVTNAKAVGVTEVKVVRDPETGRILEVVDADEPAQPNPLDDPLNDLDSDDEAEERRKKSLADQHGNTDGAWKGTSTAATDVIRQLEEQANAPRAVRKQRASNSEVVYLQALVDKHGDDYAKMARDIKTNYLQRTANDLRRSMQKWRAG